MAGDPAPLAAVQAAVLKTAAGKQGQAPPVESTQANAVAQDLAVMADQAKGYTAGVDAGTIVAQDNRAAQARRLAAERAQADAARQRQLEMEQRQTEMAQLKAQSERQSGEYAITEKKARLAKQAEAEAEEINPEWEDNALAVQKHAIMNRGPRFIKALDEALNFAENPDEAVAFLLNAQRHPDNTPWGGGVDPDVLRSYAEEYFRALEGGAINMRRLTPSTTAPAASRRTAASTTAPTVRRSPSTLDRVSGALGSAGSAINGAFNRFL